MSSASLNDLPQIHHAPAWGAANSTSTRGLAACVESMPSLWCADVYGQDISTLVDWVIDQRGITDSGTSAKPLAAVTDRRGRLPTWRMVHMASMIIFAAVASSRSNRLAAW